MVAGPVCPALPGRAWARSAGARVVACVVSFIPGSPDSATQMFKFYGHSLGDADYSYFQAIFDEVSLYESNTRLIFYYNKSRPNTTLQEKAVQEEMFEKVNRLITAYGTTLDNEDHGRNLLHKLLLEGRLTIKQAPIKR